MTIFKPGAWYEKALPAGAPVHASNDSYLREFDGAYYGAETDGTPASDSAADNYAKTVLTTTLNGAITSGATTMVVVSSASVPSRPFRVKIGSENSIVCTAVSGTTWTIVRFAGVSHANGNTVTVLHKAPAFSGAADSHSQTTFDTPVLHAIASDTLVTVRPKALAQVFDSTWSGSGFFIPERFRPTGTSGIANQSGRDGTNEGIRIPAGADAFFDVAAGTSNDNPMMIEVPDAADPSSDGYWASFAEMRYYRQGSIVAGHTITAGEHGWYAQGATITKINSYGITSGTSPSNTSAVDAGWPATLTGSGVAPSTYQDDDENTGSRGNNAACRCIVYDRTNAAQKIPNVTEFFAERTRDDGTHVWPFDGGENAKGGSVPEGSRLHIKYSIDVDAEVASHFPVGTSVNGAVVTTARQNQIKYILRGLQQYGMVVGDNSGSGGRLRTEAFQREPGSPSYVWQIRQADLTFWPFIESWEFIADDYDPAAGVTGTGGFVASKPSLHGIVTSVTTGVPEGWGGEWGNLFWGGGDYIYAPVEILHVSGVARVLAMRGVAITRAKSGHPSAPCIGVQPVTRAASGLAVDRSSRGVTVSLTKQGHD